MPVFLSFASIRSTSNDTNGLVESYGEMQWRVRQINLSFTYRFNIQKNEREKPRKSLQEDGGDFPG